jgi:hypothetical protein
MTASQSCGVGHVAAVGDGLPAGRGDLVGHGLGRPGVGPAAVRLRAEVVEHHRRALVGEQPGDRRPDAATGPGDDRDPAVERSHAVPP